MPVNKKPSSPWVICLMGPTASGKTQLGIDLVQQLPLDIVSVDSAMVYRSMDIGTAKPSAAELKLAPHRLIDICDPVESYSAGQFYHDAINEIDRIHQQGRTPLLVGGTMLYFYVLQKGFADLPNADNQLRQLLQQQLEEQGVVALHQQLQQVDALAAAQIHAHDAQRIQRALEVFYLTGQTLSEYHAKQNNTAPYHFCNLILAPTDRSVLHQRIADRFQQMLAAGFVEEVKQLFAREDLHADLPAIRTVGYRQAWQYLSGHIDKETFTQKAVIATRQLAKRQITWLRRWQDAHWFEGGSLDRKMLSREVIQLLRLSLNH